MFKRLFLVLLVLTLLIPSAYAGEKDDANFFIGYSPTISSRYGTLGHQLTIGIQSSDVVNLNQDYYHHVPAFLDFWYTYFPLPETGYRIGRTLSDFNLTLGYNYESATSSVNPKFEIGSSFGFGDQISSNKVIYLMFEIYGGSLGGQHRSVEKITERVYDGHSGFSTKVVDLKEVLKPEKGTYAFVAIGPMLKINVHKNIALKAKVSFGYGGAKYRELLGDNWHYSWNVRTSLGAEYVF